MQSLALSEEVANPNSGNGRLSQATPNFNLVGGSQTERHCPSSETALLVNNTST